MSADMAISSTHSHHALTAPVQTKIAPSVPTIGWNEQKGNRNMMDGMIRE